MDQNKSELEEKIGKLVHTMKCSPLRDKTKYASKLTELYQQYKQLTGQSFQIQEEW